MWAYGVNVSQSKYLVLHWSQRLVTPDRLARRDEMASFRSARPFDRSTRARGKGLATPAVDDGARDFGAPKCRTFLPDDKKVALGVASLKSSANRELHFLLWRATQPTQHLVA